MNSHYLFFEGFTKMQHSFDVAEATKYGIEKAVILNNLRFWLEKNKANNINSGDGYYWTYNSASAYAKRFIPTPVGNGIK